MEFKSAEHVLGGHPSSADGFDFIVKSPGVPDDLPCLKSASEKAVSVLSELELAVRQLDVPIIAVTGTNGKTTTTKLIGHILEACGKEVCVAGNVGVPLLDVLEEASHSELLVLELSSYQLELMPSLRAQVAVFLNVSPDHLDRYESFDAYVKAKLHLAQALVSNGVLISNADDEVLQEYLKDYKHIQQQHYSLLNESCEAYESNGNLKLEDNIFFATEDFKLQGKHNHANMLAALLAVSQFVDLSDQVVVNALQSFAGLKHRLEFVAELGGVKYYNDSKGTNVGATLSALSCFEPGRVVLLAGGKGKNENYNVRAEQVSRCTKQLIVFGESAESLKQALENRVPTYQAKSLEDAVEKASEVSCPGDVVLLSPACASFDMFANYAQRGEKFIEEVMKLRT